MIGKVKWFDNVKGFGFATCDEVKEDVFLHFSKINAEGFKSLNEGDVISFTLIETENGIQANDIEKKETVKA